MKFRFVSGCGFWLGLLLAGFVSHAGRAQGTAFTYQGSLSSNGLPANGSFSLRFILRPSTNGTGQVGATLINAPVGVTNGLFTTLLDFGDVFSTSPLYLEIGVRTNGSTGSFTVLSPNQLISSAPYAVQALQAASASSYTGSVVDSQLSANVPLLNSNQTYSGAVTFTNTASFSNAVGNFSGTFSGAASGTFTGTAAGVFTGTNYGAFIGNGGGVTNLNVTNLVGVVQSNPNWQVVQSGSQQAVSANNYLFTSSTQQTLTLPASPNVGSTIWVAGSGAAGWKLGQNAGQSIITGPLGQAAGQLWTQASATTTSYHAVASSANGIRLAAAAGQGYIYYSPDGGVTWTQSDAPILYWNGIASSANGSNMVAGANNASLYTSTNGGAHWTVQSASPSSYYWKGVASSASGIDLYGVAGGSIQASPDGGVTWTQRFNFTLGGLVTVCCSANGTRVATCGGAGGTTKIYVSPDSGNTWTTNGTANNYISIACSADGYTMLAAAANGNIFVSSDGGASWVQRATAQAWTGVTTSASGQYMAACYSVGYIYTSQDYGQTWIERNNGYSTAYQWSAIASSADGSRLVAGISASTGVLWLSTAATTVGTGGYLTGTQYSNVQLQHIGGGVWMPLSYSGSFTAN